MKPSVLVTAGPTREKIDPVRFISNYSTGVFGYAVAEEAARRGCRVTLVSGPTAIRRPSNVRFIGVESADEMRKAVEKEFKKHDCVIMAAAVSDWRVKKPSKKKIKRASGKKVLELEENPDILGALGRKKGKKILVGFALETEDLEKNALKKAMDKNADLIVANRLTENTPLFGDNLTDVVIVDRCGNKTVLCRRSKRQLAKIILDKAFGLNI